MRPLGQEGVEFKNCPHGEDPDECDVCWAEGNEGEPDASISLARQREHPRDLREARQHRGSRERKPGTTAIDRNDTISSLKKYFPLPISTRLEVSA